MSTNVLGDAANREQPDAVCAVPARLFVHAIVCSVAEASGNTSPDKGNQAKTHYSPSRVRITAASKFLEDELSRFISKKQRAGSIKALVEIDPRHRVDRVAFQRR
jgi:hypothetical protein